VTVNVVPDRFDRLANWILDPVPLIRVLNLGRFTGREWLLGAVDRSISRMRRGYVLIQAEAGIGKSAFAARLVFDPTRPCVHHFTRLEGGSSPEVARRSIAAQLVGWWDMAAQLCPGDQFPGEVADEPHWLVKVIDAAARKRDATSPGLPLVIVVDGLDEAVASIPSRETGIPLGLPRPETLPDGVFFVVTSRFGVPLTAMSDRRGWHTIPVAGSDNQDDMRRYLTDLFEGETANGALRDAVAAAGQPTSHILEALLAKSRGVWIYLTYVLDEIESGYPLTVDRLPDGLVGYYLDQIHRWEQDGGWSALGLPMLATLAALGQPATSTELTTFTGINGVAGIDLWLDRRFRPFLDVTRHGAGGRRYEIRHQSLRDLFAGMDADADEMRPDAGIMETLFEAWRDAHRRITNTLTPPGEPGSRDWSCLDGYARSALPAHAVTAGRLDDLLRDAGFLLAADPASLTRSRRFAGADGRRALDAYDLSATHRRAAPGDEAQRWWLYVWSRRTRADELSRECERTAFNDHPHIDYAWWKGARHQTLTGHTRWVEGVCAFVDAHGAPRLASGGSDGTLRVWDPQTGRQVRPALTGHTGGVRAVCAFVDAHGALRLASGGSDGTVRLWDPQTGRQVGSPLTGHTGGVSGVCAFVDADGAPRLASGGNDGTVRVWDPETGGQVGLPLTGHDDWVRSVCAFVDSHGAPRLASGGSDGTVRVWDLQTGRQVGSPLTGHTGGVEGLCAFVDVTGAPCLASGCNDGTVRVWDLHADGHVGSPLTGHTGGVSGVCVFVDVDGAPCLASSGDDGTVRVWNPETGGQVGLPLTGHDGAVWGVCAFVDADRAPRLASGGSDGTVRVWDPQTGRQVGFPLTGHTGGIRAVCAFVDADRAPRLASGGSDGTVRLWDPQTGRQVGPALAGHASGVSGVCAFVDADGAPCLASGGDDGTVRVWDPQTGRQIGLALTDHIGGVSGMCAFVDAHGAPWLASGGNDATVRVWDPQTGRQVRPALTGHTSGVRAVCAFVDAHGALRLASGGSDGTVRVWDPQTGRQVGSPLTGHTGVIRAVCTFVDAHGAPWLASGGNDATVRVWNPETGGQVGPALTGHDDWIRAVCAFVDADGAPRLASGGDDRTVVSWSHLPSHGS